MINLDREREWLGRVEVRSDQAAPAPLAALFATLDRDEPAPAIGDTLPPLAHWLYFLGAERRSEMRDDGCGRSAFLPPIELPLRVCAASRLQFHRPLRVGDTISRTSCIVDIAQKQGRSGPLVFVLVRHHVGDGEGVALSEDQYVVFRERWVQATRRPRRSGAKPVWMRQFRADEVTLFRYSALTFNAHRIHYDRHYASFVAGHPGLVVQGGLVAHLLLDLLRRNAPSAQIRSWQFRISRPLFDVEPFSLCGRWKDARTAELWAETAQGELAMEAIATLSEDALAAPSLRMGSLPEIP